MLQVEKSEHVPWCAVIGQKAIIAGISRVILGILMLSIPISFADTIFLLVTGRIGEIIAPALCTVSDLPGQF